MTPQMIADRLLEARTNAMPLSGVTTQDGPADEAAAYAVQALVTARLGRVGGFKIGRTTPDAVPGMAPILASTALQSGATPDPRESRLRGVELEIGFLLTGEPPATDHPDFEAELRGVVTPLAALEIVESRLEDPDAAGPLWKRADNQINGALIAGTPRTNWAACDLVTPKARLRIGTRQIWDGAATVPGGCAFATLARFARHVGTHCGGLRAGHVVITGTLTGLVYASPGDAVAGEIDGLGTVSAQFD